MKDTPPLTSDPSLPAPLTPADCDLNGLEFMPLEVNRVMQSTLFGKSTGDEFKAAFALWCASWYETPAASLPNDEEMLEFLSKSKAWRKVRTRALQGWFLCSDGRLYHETVAKVAMSAWDRRVEHREVNDSKNERQKRWRERCKLLADQLRVLGVTPPKGASLETLESLLVDAKASTETRDETSTVDRGEIGKTGEGRTGEDRGGEDSNTSEASPLHPPASTPPNGKLNGYHPELEGIPPADEPPVTEPPPCPHQQLIALYAKHLGHLRQPVKWDGARADAMRVRWRECAKPSAFSRGYDSIEGGLAFWEKFFRYVASTDLAQGFPREHGKRWMPDLPWLVTKENFLKVIEGNYTE